MSPLKKRGGGGRPPGSKNKPKVATDASRGASSSGPRKVKRRFTTKHTLVISTADDEVLDSGSKSGSSSVLESSAGFSGGAVMVNVAGTGPPFRDTIA